MKHVAGTSGLRAKVKAFALLVLSKKRVWTVRDVPVHQSQWSDRLPGAGVCVPGAKG